MCCLLAPAENIDLACGAVELDSARAALALAWSLVLSQYTRKNDAVFSLRLESRSNGFSNTPVLPFWLLVDRLCYCYWQAFFFTQALN